METPPPAGEGSAVNLTGDSPSSPVSVPSGRTLFEPADGTRFAVGGATAQAVLLMMAHPGGITTLDLLPLSWKRNTTTRFSSVLGQLRHRHDLDIDTVPTPNEHGSGWYGVYVLRTPLKRIPPDRG